ncbi:hypothetical protein CANARDRAFT_131822 [[Candida] arabinofermentans NRRL YB-2248]|uniref:Uncharacterized protein n=1 Tax=[Candida] arabinofermentans NRRL YB-2248 TaxID=983967 RepID=A0A1E4T3G0_9ASCO|nr:hypothetical protein CANARDRAFT_131822 [[Candida] arabinofermentans NRRL YB-2248]
MIDSIKSPQTQITTLQKSSARLKLYRIGSYCQREPGFEKKTLLNGLTIAIFFTL